MIKRKLHIFVEGAVDHQILDFLGFNREDITPCGGKQKMIEKIWDIL